MSQIIKCLQHQPMATLRLICIPYAGAGASVYRAWAKLLAPKIEVFAVQLPGREDRLRDPAFRQWAPMMAALTGATADLPRMPTAIFGYSLGAVVALELSRWMHRHQADQLRHLFVAARPWPGDATAEGGAMEALDDKELLSILQHRYGTLPASLSHPEIREVALPALRADLMLLDSYVHALGPTLRCPVTVYGGRADPMTREFRLDNWLRESSGPLRVQLFESEHFFIDACQSDLLADIAATLHTAA